MQDTSEKKYKNLQNLGQWEVDWAHISDQDQLLELFKLSFNHEMPVSQWRWKYTFSNPLGALVRCQNEVIAFYGGMPRKIWIFGQTGLAVQIGDVMVAPRYRRVFTRHGVLFHAASRFCEELVGPDKLYVCAYGFPSERHFRLGKHLGLYTDIGRFLKADLPAKPLRKHLLYVIEEYKSHQSDALNALWQSMRSELDAFVVLDRDKTYIQHRFLDHPEIPYLLRVVRQRISGKLLGFLVLRDHGSEGVELLDAICLTRHLPLLVSVAQQIAGHLGRNHLFIFLTESVAGAMEISPATLHDPDLPLPTLSWRQSGDIEQTRNHWWLIGGDADSR